LNKIPITADVTRDHVNNVVRKMERTADPFASPIPTLPLTQTQTNPVLEVAVVTDYAKAGRPKGSTKAAKREAKELLEAATVWATEQLIAMPKPLKRHAIVNTVKEATIKFRLPEKALNKHSIRSRMRRGNPKGRMKSPLLGLEPLLVEFCILAHRLREPLNRQSFLELANALIEGTPIQVALLEFKALHKIKEKMLSTGYYNGFMDRNSKYIDIGRGHLKDINRQLWGTYKNLDHMYDKIYELLEKTGHATKLPAPVWMDKKGRIVDEAQAFGSQVDLVLKYPERVCFFDETGCNTNQKEDGQVGGSTYIKKAGTRAELPAICSDIRWTLIPITNALGEAVCCVIIFQTNSKEIPANWIHGIDIFVDGPDPNALEDDPSLLSNHFGPGLYFPSGPVCKIGEIEVPCMVTGSPHGGVTSEILVSILKYLDTLKVFPRNDSLPSPFLIIDGHNSRFGAAFLQYIHEATSQWHVCIGVPYGTHLWQAADNQAQNGSFKIALSKAKQELCKLKKELGMQLAFTPTDVTPLVNKAWQESFGNVAKTKSALATCGWNPLNRHCLYLPEVLKTKEEEGSVVTSDTEDSMPPLTGTYTINLENAKSSSLIDELVAARDLKKARERQEAKEKRAN
jgi:hypothetical protein